ncbi:hypothetical protein EY681_03965 [Enterococcus gallinarum]|jgi:hypothetical protein|uniref:hypothetical protein n=1 Tax=Enterococcus gallinarum TaxID=1353 RepID=UPI0009BE79FC|nr:hypothetical protein [Enterococcus gallinarum]MBO6325184.1 hypothetical protein [Enterococcus gallinarum]MDL4908434.1 hypothetical protein [Enterococcus gallinarum]OQO76913.1 hypothetical protein BH745_15575 [Enterococcus gallinarum]ROY87280.1 hypothetical protein EGW76_10535 [Enterococcus gallinarum]
MNTEKLMQITIKPGIHIFVKVENFEDYKKRKNDIVCCPHEFVDVLDECTLRHSEIVAIEYFEKEMDHG